MTIADAFRDTFLEVVAEVSDPRPAIVSSAGCDSNALLCALIETGHTPTVFTFTLDDRQSRDSVAARENARRLGLESHLVTLPSDPLALGDMAHDTVRAGIRGKASIEVITPMRAMLRAVADAGYSTFLTGIQADCHFGVTKKELIHYKHVPAAFFDAYRRHYFATKAQQQCDWIASSAAEVGIEAVFPYIDQRICDVFLGHDWHALNKPRQKEAIRQFPGLERLDVDKVRSNLQLGDSGVASTLARLVEFPEVNQSRHRTVIALYNEWVRAEAVSA